MPRPPGHEPLEKIAGWIVAALVLGSMIMADMAMAQQAAPA
ncbi:hypothetical protein [Paracoccus sp. S3-43]|nr:hypothetical protein [Paracoccus sp. S3-43]WEF23946.1 hypothetical protein PXD02_14325 [Paracoccus sp. S3-43]